MPAGKRLNAITNSIDYFEANGDEITLDLVLLRKPPKGSSNRVGKGRVCLRLTLSAYQVVRLARAGRRGLEKLHRDALLTAGTYRGHLEILGKEAS